MKSILSKIFTLMIASAIFIFIVEIFLRSFGFRNPPLWVEDSRYEYRLASNQDINRFGNRILTDSLGRRNGPLGEDDCVAATFVGDSVVNGGAATDQGDLATTILDSLVGPKSRVLNVSAGSWGPDNAAAFLQAHGAGDPQLIVAVFSSHDAEDEMTFNPVVGVQNYSPKERPASAIGEAWERYIFPRFRKLIHSGPKTQNTPVHKANIVDISTPIEHPRLNPGWDSLLTYSRDRDIPFLIYLHAESNESEIMNWNKSGNMVIEYSKNNNIEIVEDIYDIEQIEYRDYIHLSAAGQARMADRLAAYIHDC